ncbi:wobble nucleotide-excising tRNase [Fontibacillus phaseoli]|uniref:Nuclease SbcCD subunit C n=1 Tax=Fontibacillus phaseoli TaxID=1416533 RepID=A0A369BGV7_9BACL|nr:AAA family ATPase [Fontibacillus phaseoli]RCX19796.1 wobble nucleotide-excising tRNase [Fontibacillus phaseoli]
MIKKIISIKNTGKFRSFTSKGEMQFNKMNIVYSENGKGKTTLSNILRSLHEQNSELVIGRRTLGAAEEQSIDILVDSTKHQFKNGKWLSKPEFDIEIFDSLFVSENVYSKFVEHDQKKQLYLFTVGKTGVEKANKLDQIDIEIKKANQNKKELETVIKAGVEGVLSIEDFIGLPNKDNLEYEIEEFQRLLNAHSKEAELKGKPLLSEASLPPFDKMKFEGNLTGHSFNDVLDKAEEVTKDHIKHRLDQHGEQWLEYGVRKITDETCPFCQQNITNVDVVQAFRSFFSDEYKKTIQLIEKLWITFNEKFNTDTLFKFQTDVHKNSELVLFWKQYISSLIANDINLDEINDVWKQFVTQIQELLEAKKRSPFEIVPLSDDANQRIDGYLRVLSIITEYNRSVIELNKIIDARRASINQTGFQNLTVSLQRLKNTKLRYEINKVQAIEEYMKLLSTIQTMNSDKNKIRDELKEYTEEVFNKYENRINYHLSQCGASFKVADFKSSFLGGKPSSNFALTINNVAVQLGTEKTPQTAASFRNTLSEGDKSSLAFAFFLAKLETDQDIDKKIIVFDDPITSLDKHRKNYTADQVIGYTSRARQVIVLTHDEFFAKMLWDKYTDKRTSLSQLCIKREGTSDSAIDSWNIEEATRSGYFQCYFTLAEFLKGTTSDLRSVATSIRPLIEGNLRVRFPNDFQSSEWLGDFIGKVRNATTAPLVLMKSVHTELENINDYSKRYHHDQNPFAHTELINETELESFVRRTLDFISGVNNVQIV